MATALHKKLVSDEIAQLSCILDPYLTGEDRVPAKKTITDEDLDRKAANERDLKEVQTALANIDDVKITALCKNMHEDNRIRRDMKITTAGHKRLLLSGLSIAYGRMKELNFHLGLTN